MVPEAHFTSSSSHSVSLPAHTSSVAAQTQVLLTSNSPSSANTFPRAAASCPSTLLSIALSLPSLEKLIPHSVRFYFKFFPGRSSAHLLFMIRRPSHSHRPVSVTTVVSWLISSPFLQPCQLNQTHSATKIQSTQPATPRTSVPPPALQGLPCPRRLPVCLQPCFPEFDTHSASHFSSSLSLPSPSAWSKLSLAQLSSARHPNTSPLA